jgi:hypothetical protein
MFDMMPKPESRKVNLFENKDDVGLLSEDNIMSL